MATHAHIPRANKTCSPTEVLYPNLPRTKQHPTDLRKANLFHVHLKLSAKYTWNALAQVWSAPFEEAGTTMLRLRFVPFRWSLCFLGSSSLRSNYRSGAEAVPRIVIEGPSGTEAVPRIVIEGPSGAEAVPRIVMEGPSGTEAVPRIVIEGPSGTEAPRIVTEGPSGTEAVPRIVMKGPSRNEVVPRWYRAL